MTNDRHDWIPTPDATAREYATLIAEARQKVVLAKPKSRPAHRLVRTFVEIAYIALDAANELQSGHEFNGLLALKRIKDLCDNRIAG